MGFFCPVVGKREAEIEGMGGGKKKTKNSAGPLEEN